MSNTWILYKYELKKIISSKMTIIMLVCLLAFAVILALNPGDSSTIEIDELQSTLNGRAIDDTLLSEMYTQLLDDYGIKWNYQNAAYGRIAYIEKQIIGYNTPLHNISAADIYEAREIDLHALMEYDRLSTEEIKWWNAPERKVETPFIYQFDGGALIAARSLSNLTMMLVAVSAMCMSAVFTVEHRQRTDQLVLSCRNGRKETFCAKIMAGITFLLFEALVAVGVSLLVICLRKGMSGLDAVVQLEVPMSAHSLTMGQFIQKQMIIMIAACILFAAAAMTISEILKNAVAAVGIMLGAMVISQAVSFSPNHRILSQAMSMVPTTQISMEALLEHRLLPFFGQYYTGFDAAPVIYLLLSILLIIAGSFAYNRFQVTGR